MQVLGAGLVATLTLAACGGNSDSGSGSGSDSDSGKIIVGLITKTDTNPFFVKMKEGAQKEATAKSVELRSYAGKKDGDSQSQVDAIDNLIAAGAKGILITPSDSKAIVPAVDRARKAGLLVIALDTPTDPATAVDATFATDNFAAGKLIGEWAKAKFVGKRPVIAMLDLNANQVSVDVQRDQGFLTGMGLNVGDPKKIGDESLPEVVGHDYTDGAETGGRMAMENLLQKNPSINLVYTINEPAAAGAHKALQAAGKEKQVTIVSVDGGCPGVADVKAGVIGATSQQYPLKMASLGVAAVAQYAKDKTKPTTSQGLDFFNTGVTLITDQTVPGLEAKDSAWGSQNCWG
jgi:fructose transport system substrate-binding protein